MDKIKTINETIMQIKRRYRRINLALLLIAIIIFIALFVIVKKKEIVKPYNKTDYELEIVKNDLKFYDLSDEMQNTITEQIRVCANKYKIPVLLLHAIFRIESDYRFYVTHNIIYVKGAQTNAIGLGGVVWEYWADSLIQRRIALAKTDLFVPEKNIEATAYILRTIVNRYKHNINIRAIIKSYYGEDNKTYYDKMLTVTSDLFLKRIEQQLRRENV